MKMDVFPCLIISPADLGDDRDAVVRAMEAWNAHTGRPDGKLLHPVRWETHATPEFGGEPQAILNRQVVDGCECAVALFWSRLGTPTSEHASGSVEEIDRLANAGKRVFIYNCTRPIPKSLLDPQQLQRLAKYLETLRTKALVADYGSTDELRLLLAGHLSALTATTMRTTSGRADDSTPVAGKTSTPLRVKTSFALPTGFGRAPPMLLAVSCQNHSEQIVRVANISVELTNGNTIQPLRDFQGGRLDLQPVIAPGDSTQLLLDFADLVEAATSNAGLLRRVVVRDRLDREYKSDEDAMAIAVANYRSWTARADGK